MRVLSPSIQEAESSGPLNANPAWGEQRGVSEPGLHCEILSHNKTKQKQL